MGLQRKRGEGEERDVGGRKGYRQTGGLKRTGERETQGAAGLQRDCRDVLHPLSPLNH